MVPKIRKSEQKRVVDHGTHESLQARYMAILDELIEKYPVTSDDRFKELVNFKKNKQLPVHRWFDYKQGYAEELVTTLLQQAHLKPNQYVLDPFNGVGTTQVAAKALGYNSVGLDINPVATLAAKVKTHTYTADEKTQIADTLRGVQKLYTKTKKIPKYKKLHDIFTPAQLAQMLSIKGFFEALPLGPVQDFFKLAFLSIIEECSNRIKDGNGIKIAYHKRVVEDVYGRYESQCQLMLKDLLEIKGSGQVIVIQGSLLHDDIRDKIKNLDIGAAIFSPPYANCFDYCEVYKMEIWLGDFVDDYDDFGQYRTQAIRSHVNAKFSTLTQNYNEHVDTIATLIGTYNIWNKHIPDMLRGYFDDMHEMLKRVYAAIQSGGLCSIVVANSGYKGVLVPTDLLLAMIGEAVGFRVESILLARDIRASSQQIKELKSTSNLMRESVLLLRKP